MFKRVRSEPNGNVTFEYGNSIITIDKNGTSKIKSTFFEKGNYERMDNIRHNSTKHISDKLH